MSAPPAAHTARMSYFNYHATAMRLLREGRLTGWYFTDDHRGIRPALVLVFDDPLHPVMPIREHRWDDYLPRLKQTGIPPGKP